METNGSNPSNGNPVKTIDDILSDLISMAEDECERNPDLKIGEACIKVTDLFASHHGKRIIRERQ